MIYLFMVFLYIKVYNTRRSWDRWFTWSPQYRKVSYATFCRVIRPMISMMAHFIDEIHWDDRLAYDNHHSFFPTGVSFVVDTYPMISLCYIP